MPYIDLDAILETANLGVRRTAVFLGLGVNAANDDALQDYQLTKMTQLQLVPPDADRQKVQEFKAEFARWIIGCGLRELVETFGVFLDQVHNACLIFAVNRGKMPAETAQKDNDDFIQKGVRGKLERLESRFQVTTTGAAHIGDIVKVRNCLTHRRSIVGPEDCDGNAETLTVRWPGMDLYVETPTGETIPLDPPIPEGGILVEAGGRVMLRRTERVHAFRPGQVITITPRDLSEVCLLFLLASREVWDNAVAYAKAIGVPHIHAPQSQ